MKIKATEGAAPAEQEAPRKFELEVHGRYPMVFECFDALPRLGPIELNVSVRLWPGTPDEVRFAVVGLTRAGKSVHRAHEALELLDAVFEHGAQGISGPKVCHE